MSNTLEGQVQQQGQVQGLSELAKRNLEANKTMWREEWVYVRLDSGETRVLKFNAEKIKHIEGQYGKRVSYGVIDPEFPDKDKKFECGKRVSTEIDNLLASGVFVISITKEGEGTSTTYEIEPAA